MNFISSILKNNKPVHNLRQMSYLINNEKYKFLHDLGLSEENYGVYNGSWKGSGKVSTINFFVLLLHCLVHHRLYRQYVHLMDKK